MELIDKSLKQYLDSEETWKKLSALESAADLIEQSIKTLGEKYEIKSLEDENRKVRLKLDTLEQHSKRNWINVEALACVADIRL